MDFEWDSRNLVKLNNKKKYETNQTQKKNCNSFWTTTTTTKYSEYNSIDNFTQIVQRIYFHQFTLMKNEEPAQLGYFRYLLMGFERLNCSEILVSLTV